MIFITFETVPNRWELVVTGLKFLFCQQTQRFAMPKNIDWNFIQQAVNLNGNADVEPFVCYFKVKNFLLPVWFKHFSQTSLLHKVKLAHRLNVLMEFLMYILLKGIQLPEKFSKVWTQGGQFSNFEVFVKLCLITQNLAKERKWILPQSIFFCIPKLQVFNQSYKKPQNCLIAPLPSKSPPRYLRPTIHMVGRLAHSQMHSWGCPFSMSSFIFYGHS